MKAKFYMGVLAAGALTVTAANAQLDDRGYRGGNGSVVVNNYYDNYDYFYASRINRFHRSYAHFDYYTPIFTDSYWYNYQPFTWGLSIYGGSIGLGFNYASPSYRYGMSFGPNWNYPYFSSSYYWGYDSFNYRPWYSPRFINFNIGYNWPGYYWGYNGRDHFYHPHPYEYSMYHNGYSNFHNDYYNSGRYTSSGNDYRRNAPSHVSETYNNVSRRGSPSEGNAGVVKPERGDRRGFVSTPSNGEVNHSSSGIINDAGANRRNQESSSRTLNPVSTENATRRTLGEQPRHSTAIYNNQTPVQGSSSHGSRSLSNSGGRASGIAHFRHGGSTTKANNSSAAHSAKKNKTGKAKGERGK